MNNNQMPLISIVIPCLNEADSIPVVIPQLIEQIGNRSIELIVVDDNSSDTSVALLEKYDQIKLIKNERRLGYGGALKKGFSLARGQYLTFLDLDRTYNSLDLDLLITEIQNGSHAMVFGDRMSKQNQMPKTRFVGNWLFATLLQILYFVRINDACTGFRIFKRDLLPAILNIEENGLNFSIAMTVVVLNAKVSISQIPIRYDERIGQSKLSVIKDGFRFLGSIFKYYIKRAT